MVDYGTFQQQVSKLIWGGGLRAKSRGGLMPYSSLFPALQPRHVVQLQEQLLLSCCGDIQQQAATLLWEELHYIYTVSSLLFFHSHTVIINTYFARKICICGLFRYQQTLQFREEAEANIPILILLAKDAVQTCGFVQQISGWPCWFQGNISRCALNQLQPTHLHPPGPGCSWGRQSCGECGAAQHHSGGVREQTRGAESHEAWLDRQRPKDLNGNSFTEY